jgi:hypothetical protein
MSLRLSLPKFRTLTPSLRAISTSAPRYTTAGYGDPQDEKIENNTPTPGSTPHPTQKGAQQSNQSGSTDPEVAQKTGNAGSSSSGSEKSHEGTEVKETKKIGEQAKEEEVGGAGPIGG